MVPVVNIQVVRTCNLRCSFCSHDVWKDKTGFMTEAMFYNIVDSLRADDIRTVAFVSAQGESLLHPKIMEMLAAARSRFQEVNLVTNGTPLNLKRVADLAALGLDSIQFSFAGYDKESYEVHYVGGKFDQVARNLGQTIRETSGTMTALSINGVCPDKEFMDLTWAYLVSLGADPKTIRLQLAHNWGGTVKAGQEQNGIYSHRDLTGAKLGMCPLLISTPGIYIDGRVTACGCIDANGALEIGDITKESMAEIRAGQRYKALVAAFETGDPANLPPLCRGCEIPYRSAEVLSVNQ